jgi:hypothetical protein
MTADDPVDARLRFHLAEAPNTVAARARTAAELTELSGMSAVHAREAVEKAFARMTPDTEAGGRARQHDPPNVIEATRPKETSVPATAIRQETRMDDLAQPYQQAAQAGQASANGYAPARPNEEPPLPPGWTGDQAREVFKRWRDTPNPALLTGVLAPLLPWLQYQLREHHEIERQTRAWLDKVKAGQPARRVELVRASAVQMRVPRFLLRTPQVSLPCGELTIAAGREGTGKSQCSLGWAAALTIGRLPGDSNGRARSVIVVAKEDSWQHTIKPRLVACGADLDRVLWLRVVDADTGSSFELSLPADLDELEATITAEDVAMVILDPLLSVLSSRLDTHKAGEVRHALEPLAEVAHRTGCAFTGLAHFAKMEGRDPASLISGSHAFKDVARAIVVFAMDGEDTGVMSQVKNSLGPMPRESLEYRICSKPLLIEGEWAQVPVFYPGAPTHRHVEDLMASGSKRAGAQARDYLRGALSGGWRLAKEVEDEAEQNGIAKRTLERARSDLRVSARKLPNGAWLVGLPSMQK